MAFTGYKAALDEFWNHYNRSQVLQFFDDHKLDINLTSTSSCLSVGPGSGEFDIQIIRRLLPGLKQYVAVEKDQGLYEELLMNLNKVAEETSSLQINAYRKDVQEWEGPAEKVDLILLNHVLCYLEDIEKLLKKCKSWLSPGGCLWIMKARWEEFYENMSAYLPLDTVEFTPIPKDEDIAHLMDFKNLKKYTTYATIDFSNPTEALASLFLNRSATAVDFKAFQKMVIDKYSSKGYVMKEELELTLNRA